MRNKIEFLTNRMGHRWEKFEAKELTHYRWDIHRAKRTPTWYWNKFNVDTDQTFFWEKRAVQEDTQYTWKKYQQVNELIRTDYYWDKHNVLHTPKFPSWTKDELDSASTYFWDKYDAVEKRRPLEESKVLVGYYTSGIDSYYGNIHLASVWDIETKSGVWAVDLRENDPYCWYYNPDIYEDGVWCDPGAAGTNARNLATNGAVTVYSWYPNLWYRTGLSSSSKLIGYQNLGTYVAGTDIWIQAYGVSGTYPGINDPIATKTSLGDIIIEICENTKDLINSDTDWFNSPRTTLRKINISQMARTRGMTNYTLNSNTQNQSIADGIADDVHNIVKEYDNVIILCYTEQGNKRSCLSGSFSIYPDLHDNGFNGLVVGKGEDFTIKVYPGLSELMVQLNRCDIDDYYANANSIHTYRHYFRSPSSEEDVANAKKLYTYKMPGALLGIGDYYYKTSVGVPFNAYEHGKYCLEDGVYRNVMFNTHYLWTQLFDANGNALKGHLVHPPNDSSKPYPVIAYEDIPSTAGPEIDLGNGFYMREEVIGDTTHASGGKNGLHALYIYPWGVGEKYYEKGDYIGEVHSKNHTAYPQEGYQGGYYYEFTREQTTHMYAKVCSYTSLETLDTTDWLSIVSKPVLNRNTGQWTYTLGGDETYLISPEGNAWVEKISSTEALYWTSIWNDGSMAYDYGTYVGAQYQDSQYYQDMSVVLEYVHSAGDYIETLTTNTPDSFPIDGEEDEYWYIFKKEVPIINSYAGEYAGDYSYLNQMYYPMDGPMDGYWWVYIGKRTLYSAGQLEGMVSDTVSSAYPANGRQNGQWYIYSHSEFIQHKGQLIERISSTLGEDAYPVDGIKGYYWYEFVDYKVITTKEEKLGTDDTTDPDAYPNDQALGDYWYIRTGQYTKVDPVLYLEDVWSETSGAYPNNGVSGNFWYKYVGQRYIPRYIIGDKDLKGGVKYKQDVNTSDDYIPGDVGCAEIQFTIFTEPREAQKYLDLECDYLYRMKDTDGWTRVGHFTVTYASDKTATTTKLKAYDNIIKTEKVADDIVNTKALWPIRLDALFSRLCQHCGVASRWDSSAINRDFMVPNNFTTSNITVRQLLALVAEVAAGFVKAEEDGTLVIRGYKDKLDLFTKKQYKDVTKAIYQTQDITKINIAGSTDDLGVSFGTGDVLYRIINNPLLYIQDEHEIDTQMQNIFGVVSAVRYTPAEMTIYDPADVQCGDIIAVDGEDIYVMSREWDGSKVKITAKGQRERTVEENPIDGSIDALRGKTNELKRTIDETNSRITDVEAGLRSEIKQTAGEIYATITNTKQGLESQIRQTADSLTASIKNTKENLESQLQLTASSLTATIQNNKDELEGKLSLTASQFQTQITDTKAELQSTITQTKDSIVSQITQQGQVVTEISQRLDGIKLVYNSTNGTASITIGDITVSNLVNGQYVQQQVAGIDMTGYVRFNDLERKGSTVINGSNITTGTIDADRINLTGAITFSDLSSSLQNKIEGSSGGGTPDPVTGLPSYIKNTYIDATTIYSPNIYGGRLIARNDSSDGYTEMTGTGLNIHSSAWGKAIIGLGYLPNHYNEPYITLGRGVDTYGTDTGLIKKYSGGIWIGDTDDINGTGSMPASGTGLFVNFTQNRIYKVINGVATQL